MTYEMDRAQKHYAGKLISNIVGKQLTYEGLFNMVRAIVSTPEQWEEHGDAFVARMMEEEEQSEE